MGKPKPVRSLAIIVLALFIFLSCKDHEAIDEKQYQIKLVDDSLRAQEDICYIISQESDSLTEQKSKIEMISRSFADSAKAIMKDSPIATLYIHENSQDESELLMEYVSAHKDSLATALFFYHLGLAFYGAYDSNQETIRYVETETSRLDEQIKLCISKISELSSRLRQLEVDATDCRDLVKHIADRKKVLEQELYILEK